MIEMRKREILSFLLVFAVIVPLPAVIAYYNRFLFLPKDRILVTARQFEFEPKEIVVNRGDTVRLFITSDDVEHGFDIHGYEVNVNIYPGVPVEVEFVADKAGEFEFMCSVYCDQGHWNMKGKLLVQETAPPGSLQVTVKDSNSSSIKDATVAISGPTNANGITDSDGQYTFSNIIIGNYSITTSKSGYTSNTTTATVISQETTSINVILTQALGVKEFHVEAWIQEDGGFSVLESPDGKTITVNKGDTVRLIVTSKDTIHGLGIDDFGVNTGQIAVGSTKTVEFVATVSGTFTYHCTVYCSSKHPYQKGILIVQP